MSLFVLAVLLMVLVREEWGNVAVRQTCGWEGCKGRACCCRQLLSDLSVVQFC